MSLVHHIDYAEIQTVVDLCYLLEKILLQT